MGCSARIRRTDDAEPGPVRPRPARPAPSSGPLQRATGTPRAPGKVSNPRAGRVTPPAAARARGKMRPCAPSPPPPKARARCGCSTTPKRTGPSSNGSRSPTAAPSPTSAASSQTASRSRYAACATAARPTPSASRSTPPAATATRIPSCALGSPPAPRKRPSTPPAPSTSPGSATSQTRDPELNPRRTYGAAHLVQADPGVEDGVQDVDEHVRDDDPGRCHDHDADDHRQFVLVDLLYPRVAETAPAASNLGGERTAVQRDTVVQELTDQPSQ